MAKLKNRKPLKKYQYGGSNWEWTGSTWSREDPWGFPSSGLSNPSTYDVTKGLTGTGTLDVMKPGQNSINFGDNPFGAQLMGNTAKTAQSLGSIPGMSELDEPMPEWNWREATRLRREIGQERGYIYDGDSDTYTDPKTGQKYSKDDMDVFAAQRYDAEKEKRAQY